MDEHHLSADEFLTRLTKLFASISHDGHGRSVFLTQKRLTPHSEKKQSDPLADLSSEVTYPILVRAKRTEEKNVTRLSTVVQERDLEIFFTKYAEVCKTGMSSLKKRDRGAQKAKLKAKKEKERERKAKEEKKP